MAKFDFPSSPSIDDVYTSGNTTWQWDGTAWNVVTASAPLTAQNIWTQINADTGSTSANTTSDALTIAGGTDIATTITDDTLTINYTGTGGGGGGSGEANQNAFSNIAVSGQTTVAADTTTDTLTLIAGTGITLTTNATDDSITLTASGGGGGSSTFDALTDASTASLTIDKIYEPAIAMLRVDNSGTSAYTFNSHYSGNNPQIQALAGTTIAFDLDNIGGHPFEIQDPTSSPYNTGLVHVSSNGTVQTGSSAQNQTSGTLYWRIPETISGVYRYQCTSHIAMVGGINIKRLSVI